MTDTTSRFRDAFDSEYSESVDDLAQKYPDKRSLQINFETLAKSHPGLAQAFLDAPIEAKHAADTALTKLLEEQGVNVDAPVHTRLQRLPNKLTEITAYDPTSGTLTEISGTVTAADEPTTVLESAVFTCKRCGSQTTIAQDNTDTLDRPATCPGCEHADNIEVDLKQSTFQSQQTATVAIEATTTDPTSKTESITVTVIDDLVGITAGTQVTITGVFQRTQVDSTVKTNHKIMATAVRRHNVSYPNTDGQPSEIQTEIEKSLEYLPTADEAREEETKARLITPLLEALGWQKFHPGQWRFEYTDNKTSKRVDYALFATPSEHPDVVVEAKQLGTNLEAHETQLYDYLRLFNAQAGILTDGKTYRIYRNPSDNEPSHTVTATLTDIATGDLGQTLHPSMFVSETSPNTDPSEMEWANTVAADINPDPDPKVIRTLLQAVRDSSHESGIPRGRLHQHGEEQGFSEAMVNAAIEELRVQGRIYEAIDGHLRSTE